jgi:hypothetical protein
MRILIDVTQILCILILEHGIEKLSSAIDEFEEARGFVFPTQETKLYLKWNKMKRVHELLFYSIEKENN